MSLEKEMSLDNLMGGIKNGGLVIFILMLIIFGSNFYYKTYVINNSKNLKIVKQLDDKEIKKIILNQEKNLLMSKVLEDENSKNYRVIRDSLERFPNEGEYKVQSLRLDSLVTVYQLLQINLSKLKTDIEKEEALKEYLEVDTLEPRYLILIK